MGDSVFVDTNVLIYADAAESPFHESAQNRLKELVRNGQKLWISRQVIREYLVIISRKMVDSNSYDSERLSKRVQELLTQFYVADHTAGVTSKLLQLINRYAVKGKAIHDCAIVATLLSYDIKYLLTHNANDFTRYEEDFELLPLLQTK